MHLNDTNTYTMKIANALKLTTLLVLAGATTYAQEADSTGLPGDHFSLSGALEMFKKAESPEEFERMINTQDNNVNNLDLNGDGDIDYIKVIDRNEADAHVFILQATVSETENQDVAVIEMQKEGDEKASLQIIGDEDIYGEALILEPVSQRDESPTQAKSANTNVNVNVWTWPMVRYVYTPSYRVWVSPYGWRVRPTWWRPWRPVRYHVFYPYRAPYRTSYVVVNRPTITRAHRIYAPARTTSVTVRTRNQASVTRYRAGRATRTTVVTNGKGDVKAVKRTTVKGKRGTTRKTTRVRRVN